VKTASSIDVAERLIATTGRIRRSVRRELLPDTGPADGRGDGVDDATNLTLSQEAAIGHLTRGGPMTTADLARVEGVRPQSMGLTIQVLSQLGLVEKSPDPKDARRTLVALTDAGVESRASARDRRAGLLASRLESRLDPDEIALIDRALTLLDTVVER
jgi:DNA-binding MarR family transcriptional regulator